MSSKAADGTDPLHRRAQILEQREAALVEREDMLRAMDRALEDRQRAIESTLAERETALRQREGDVWQREDTQRLVQLAIDDLEAKNADLRQANEKLVMATLEAQELKEAGQRARRRQDEFLAMLSHELRNPLAPISAAVEVLAQLAGKPIPERLLDVVRRQVKHLVRLVDDLLDVSRVTEGKVTLQRKTTSVADFVQQAVDTCRPEIASRKQTLTLQLDPMGCFVDGDGVRLTQIITNLLQNASKYTQETGEISIGSRRREESVEITVRDNGSGITAKALPHVFDLFMQDETSLSRAQGGLGIGLTVVRRMVEMHGGTVQARSAGRGLGSEFVVTLPTVEPSSAANRPPQASPGPAPTPARILIVEDNVDAGNVLAELLRLSGHEVQIALDGLSGLARFEQMRPQVVLCDIGLPEMDGYEVIRRMRERKQDPRPALIAVTGYGGPTNADRALIAGFDYHVVKPVNPETIARLIDTAMRVEEWTTSGHGALTGHGSLRDDDRRGRPV